LNYSFQILFVILLLFIATFSRSQSNDTLSKEATFSPYQLSWKTDGIIAGTGISLRLLGEFLPQKELLLDEEETNTFTSEDLVWFDRAAIDKFKPELINLSTSMNYYAFIAPLPLFLSRNVRNDFLTITTMFIETRLFAEAAPMITKKLFPRYRPYVFSQEFDFETKEGFNDSRSFFSNQSAYVFSSAVFTAKVFNDFYPESKARYWIWGSALTTATAISVFRHEIGIHYLSDLVVGAAIGSALGYFIPHFHLKEKKNSRYFSLSPRIGVDYAGININYML
jgi:membrane-associated phospholipid phosphatase